MIGQNDAKEMADLENKVSRDAQEFIVCNTQVSLKITLINDLSRWRLLHRQN